MKRAFTLLELMIVVALIATMMTIVLRLSSVSTSSGCRNTTVMRLARLENCLSGYYAAYGNYPPVRLHNTRDIYQEADGHGVQSTGNANENIWGWDAQKFLTDIAANGYSSQKEEREAWSQVEAACRAQPVGAEFPFPDTGDSAEDIQDFLSQLQANLSSGEFKNYPQPGSKKYEALQAGFDGLQSNWGRFNKVRNSVSWRDIQVFKFGMMSFLLPRYQMMMRGDEHLYTYLAQWTKNNGTVSNPMTGQEYSWDDLNEINKKIDDGTSTKQDEAELENIPADAVCVRWLPNLEGICSGTRPHIIYFGVDITDENESSTYLMNVSDDPSSSMPSLHIYSPHGDSTSDQYILDSLTVLDGWDEEFYYYSPSPHQSYQLWSSGANKRTFPPWVPRAQLSSKAGECVTAWTADDIRGMSN